MKQPDKPTSPDSNSGSAGAAADAATGPRKRILLIEDEPTARLVLLQKLRSAGFDVDVAVNGLVALEKICTSHPDAIFMDLLLPRVEGVDVIKAARRDPQFGNRPVYVCTSAARMNVWARKGTKAGATKVFDRAATPIDDIVAEIAADLLGRPRPTWPSDKVSVVESKPKEQEVPIQPKASASPAAKIPASPVTSVGQNSTDPQTKSSAAHVPFMKRVMKSLGLGRENDAPKEPAARPLPPDPLSPISAPNNAAIETGDSALEGINAPSVDPSGSTLDGIDAPSVDLGSSTLDGIDAPSVDPDVAILTLDETAKILSVNNVCAGMFGWDGPKLVGQNLSVLLKDGLQQDIGKLLQQQRTSDDKITCPLNTVARKRDGTEFPVSITTLTWSSETTFTRKSGVSAFCWTAFIREAAKQIHTHRPIPTGAGQGSPVHRVESIERGAEPAASQAGFEALQAANEKLQKQLQEIMAEAATRQEDLAKRQKECDDLIGQISQGQVELTRARSEVEQENGQRKQLEQLLQQLKQDLEHQTAKHARLEAEWREQLQRDDWAGQLSQSQTDLNRTRSELEQEGEQRKQLEQQLRQLKQELELQTAEHARLEAEWRERFERDDLAGQISRSQTDLNRTRGELEQESEQRKQLEQQLQQLKRELEQQSAERARLETEWRGQLSGAEALTKRLEAGWQEEVGRNRNFEERLKLLGNSLSQEQAERSRRFEQEVLGLRRERDELQNKLNAEHDAAAEFKRRTEELELRLRDSAAESERVKSELDKQTLEQQRLESEWRESLKSAEDLTNRLQAAWLEAEAYNKHSEEELTGLRQVRDQLQAELASEQHAAAESERRNGELANSVIQNTAEVERLKTELEQGGTTEHFEERLNGLKQARAELDGELWTGQQVTADARRRIEDLENRLSANSAELERVKTEADQRAEEQARLQAELQAQLNEASASVKQVESALNEKTEQCRQFETQLSALGQLRDELGGKLAAEQQAAAASRQRTKELETGLQESAAELERVKAERDKQVEEQSRLENELRAQLDAAKGAAAQAETALKEEAANNRAFEERLRLFGDSLRLQQVKNTERFETELITLQQERDELGRKLAAEQGATAESKQRCEQFESRLREAAAELERVQGELARHVAERAQLESEQRAQLDSRVATDKAEEVSLEETERSQQFEEELASLRRERDELHDKFTAGKEAVAESRRHADQLENQLCETAAALEELQAELARHATERARLDSRQRAEIDAGKAAIDQAEAARVEEAERAHRFEEELAGLRREHDELNQKFTAEQQAVAESRTHAEGLASRLGETAAALESAQGELTRRGTEQIRLDSIQHGELDSAKAAAEKAEAALAEKTGLCNRFQEEAARLWQECEALSAKLASEQQAAVEFRRRSEEIESRLRDNRAELEAVKTSQSQQAEEQKRLEADWHEQLAKAQASAASVEEALKEEVSLRHQVERTLFNLRNERHQVYDRFKAEHEAGIKSKRRIDELEKRLRERNSDLKRAKSALQKHAAERGRVESELRGQVATARAMAHQELDSLRQERETLTGRVAAERRAAEEFKRRTEEFEGRLDEMVAELERVKIELDQRAQEQARLESERQSLTEAKEALGLELRHLHESEAAHKADIAQLEGRLAESVGLLARTTSELETERSERGRLEQRAAALAAELQKLHEELKQHLGAEQANEQRIAELMQQLREREEAVTRMSLELQAETLHRQTAEEQLRAAGELSNQLRDHLSLLEEAKQVFASREHDLESRLQASLDALRESEDSVEKETGERRRLEESLQAAQQERQRQAESNALELSKLKSAAQVEQLERKSLEAQIVQSRYSSLDSVRVGTEMANSLRNRIRQPIEKLIQATRRLLEIQSDGEQKKLVESLLENALLVRSGVREGGRSKAGPSGDDEDQGGSGERSSAGLRSNKAGGKLQP